MQTDVGVRLTVARASEGNVDAERHPHREQAGEQVARTRGHVELVGDRKDVLGRERSADCGLNGLGGRTVWAERVGRRDEG